MKYFSVLMIRCMLSIKDLISASAFVETIKDESKSQFILLCFTLLLRYSE